MEISYRKIGDYYIPNLTIDEETRTYNLGKYSRLRLKYLKENKRKEFEEMLRNQVLHKHLNEVQNNCTKMREELIEEYKIKDGFVSDETVSNYINEFNKYNLKCIKS